MYDLDRAWDTRWTRAEQDEAVRRADEQALQARAEIDRAIDAVDAAVKRHADAMSWMSTARAFRDQV